MPVCVSFCRLWWVLQTAARMIHQSRGVTHSHHHLTRTFFYHLSMDTIKVTHTDTHGDDGVDDIHTLRWKAWNTSEGDDYGPSLFPHNISQTKLIHEWITTDWVWESPSLFHLQLSILSKLPPRTQKGKLKTADGNQILRQDGLQPHPCSVIVSNWQLECCEGRRSIWLRHGIQWGFYPSKFRFREPGTQSERRRGSRGGWHRWIKTDERMEKDAGRGTVT